MLAVALWSLTANAAPKQQVVSLKENYQVVYRRLYLTAKGCLKAGFLMSPQASMDVDGQLYNDLGFGEITYYQSNFITIKYATAKVEKSGTGSRVTVVSKNTINNASMLNKFLSWARGGTTCSGK
jgi:hypothetical protein